MRAAPYLLAICLVPAGIAAFQPSQASQTTKVVAARAPEDLGDPIPGLSDAHEDLFLRGRRLFRWELWRPDPTSRAFNETECSKCHREPYFGGSNIDAESYAPFIPDEGSTTGYKAYPRRQRESGRSFTRVALPDNAELRRAPSLFGAGLIEAVPVDDLKKLSDPNDSNKDGISGRLLAVGKSIGRFGWKGHIEDIDTFTVDAFKTELGMNISSFERDDFGGGLGASQLRAVVHYIRTLGPPPVAKLDGVARKGRDLFAKLACASCHTPKLVTGNSPIEALSNKAIEIYSDLQLHEIGDGEIHKISGAPSKTEYRTTPLWGVGSFSGPFWHDGSAKTLEDAILKHDGEGAASRDAFQKLPNADRNALLGFLKKL